MSKSPEKVKIHLSRAHPRASDSRELKELENLNFNSFPGDTDSACLGTLKTKPKVHQQPTMVYLPVSTEAMSTWLEDTEILFSPGRRGGKRKATPPTSPVAPCCPVTFRIIPGGRSSEWLASLCNIPELSPCPKSFPLETETLLHSVRHGERLQMSNRGQTSSLCQQLYGP